MIENIGLIAGGGQFPIMIARAAKKQGHYIVAVAHDEETEPSLSEHVDEIVWIKLGQLGKLIRAFKKSGVKKALMAGSITKQRMFGNIMPDFKGISLASKLAIFHDDSILGAAAKELEKEGIEIVSSTYYLPKLFTSPACLTKKRPGRAEMEDIDFGWQVAKEIGRLDIGQCVVVRKKTVLAVEAIEGTDKTILRGGGLAGEKAVIVKVSKPQQDLRFDVPSVGLETIKVMSRVKAS
ncbi:MAG: LpxI family protein, partial [bacterium]|nr:LpxI family protein [bacterium]